ncbi:2880_t:CDS:2 [Paraglomus brasilianum]|uniref:2880_t:CDS:1 n=1 Tax=Paraglomus brasilianum TaxID=144538 RepID=A0A9N9FPC8_9GLOM|nr:2880_t:CDS:2 [Paraglomus brasilianum]
MQNYELEDAKQLYNDIHEYLDFLSEMLLDVADENPEDLPPNGLQFLDDYKSYITSPKTITHIPSRSRQSFFCRRNPTLTLTIDTHATVSKLEYIKASPTFTGFESDAEGLSPTVKKLRSQLGQKKEVESNIKQGLLAWSFSFYNEKTEQQKKEVYDTTATEKNTQVIKEVYDTTTTEKNTNNDNEKQGHVTSNQEQKRFGWGVFANNMSPLSYYYYRISRS